MRASVAMACVLVLAGCGTRKARTYAVTLLDSDTLECVGVEQGLLADPAELEKIAGTLHKAWKRAADATPPRPEPRVLRINELETQMQAWFDPGSGPTGREGWLVDAGTGGAGGGWVEDVGVGGSAAAAQADPWFGYAQGGTVYQGELHDDYVEGSYADSFDTDGTDLDAGRHPCGVRNGAQGTLSLTRVGGVQGRIRWTRSLWVGSEFSACEGRVDCARNITIDGLEIE